jgi:uncharacterized RDD family membrane protein YckC
VTLVAIFCVLNIIINFKSVYGKLKRINSVIVAIMLLVKLDTGFNIEVEFPISPFHKRLFAWLIDVFILWIYIQVISAVIDSPLYAWHWSSVLGLLPVLLYFPVSEIAMRGQTVGKMALRIKVITEEGGQPTAGQYLIRWLFRMIDFPIWLLAAVILRQLPWWTLPLIFLGLACVIFTPRSQRVGDLLAGTILIDLKNRTSWQDTVFTAIESTYKPRYPQVMQLSDRDLNTLKSIIKSVRKNNDYQLAMKIADRIKSKLKMDSEQESIDFLETLLKDYNYYSTN